MSQKRSDGPGIGSGPLGAKRLSMALALGGLTAMAVFAPSSQAADPVSCQRTVTADVVAFDKPLMYNRMGAGNVNGLMFALKRDVVDAAGVPLTVAGANPVAGQLDLRGDKRQRPLALRVRKGDCLTVNLTNWLTTAGNANPRNVPFTDQAGEVFRVPLDEQVADRRVGFHSAGMQLVNSIADDGSFVGNNASSLAEPGGGTKSYTLFAQKEGVFAVKGDGAPFGSDGNEGLTSLGLFGQVIVEPTGAAIYRGQVFEEELRLATASIDAGTGLPILSYEATYPATNADGSPSVWVAEGKAGLPVLNMMQCSGNSCEIVHSEINGVIAHGPSGQILGDGKFPASTYPIEAGSNGTKRNPTLPNRLEPFRDYASVFHDETVNGQAFPGFFIRDRVFNYVLAGVKDAFMINYGSGGIGSEIIANRLGVGPMHDCLSCAYEEFFLTSFTVADPGMTVDIPANFGLEALLPGQAPPPGTQGPKANYAIGAEDPANIHHSYIGDFVKFRNTHNGKEQHVFHLHNHQWLYNPNDDNANYLDAQGIGPGIGYTYEINFGGSGNRNKSAGDAIFHCHFYPHFAQGMWYHWRNHDVFEAGTKLAASGAGFHTTRWALANTTPAAGARALPDGEIATGTPIPAVVPLPGKALAPAPGFASVMANPLTVPNTPQFANPGAPVGSLADLGRVGGALPAGAKNPGYPFWIAGIEDTVGQRPPTPPLDMLSKAQAQALKDSGNALWSQLNPDQAAGFDGGLRRHALKGVAAGGTTAANVVSPTDFSKVLGSSDVVYFPEEGNDVEQLAMRFHSVRTHSTITSAGAAASFVTNGGGGPVVGAPYHNPCIDDQGRVLKTGVTGNFFSADLTVEGGLATHGRSVFNSDTPRIYKGTNLQFDAVLNKVGYHFPQQRIVALWEDVGPVTAKQKAPEPLVMRLNTFDCAIYHHSNLVPEAYEIDDYQVRTPTDIIGQHIHLPKWDLTTTDGSANGWNYEDGTLSPGAVRERIHAIRAFNLCTDPDPRDGTDACPVAQPHPFFGGVAEVLDGATVGTLPARENFEELWLGARTTMQRWFADPVVNTEGVDRGLGIIFTHDHYGPSTHQQVGLYSTVLTEPAASQWVHNETGTGLGCTSAVNSTQPVGTTAVNNTPCRWDGGPTSWQAAILPQPQNLGQTVGAGTLEAFREFYFEYTDFQHAYEAGVYVGANQKGQPLAGTGPALAMQVGNEGNPQFTQAGVNKENAFRFAINPPARFQIAPVFPDLVVEAVVCVKDALGGTLLSRPCPQAIDVQDPGLLVVNYRHEPVALRIYDPNKIGPDGKAGMQADGERGDLAFALQSRTDRAIPQMNVQPVLGTNINGTLFPARINAGGVKAGDPFTAMVRTYTGDMIRVKMQAGGDEEEHNATIHGMKWLQGGSGHGKAPNSGWRNAQAAGISEQFTLAVPVTPSTQNVGSSDYFYSMDGGNDGWWSGMWGILRSYNTAQNDLFQLPTTQVPIRIANANAFRGNRGACPDAAPVRPYDITAVLANSALGNALGATINPGGAVGTQHVGGALNNAGGTLVYNHRAAVVGGGVDPETGAPLPTHQGPIHDPTAILYVYTDDLVPQGAANTAANRRNMAIPVKLAATAPVEPVVIRAGAGECVQVILRNRLPALATVALPDLPPLQVVNPDGTVTQVPATGLNSTAPDLATYSSMLGVNKRDRFLLEGSTTFQTNLFRASSWVGVTPGLAAIDVNRDSGIVIGENAAGQALVTPGNNKTYFWYAGDLAFTRTANRQFQLNPTPVEFGGANILSADRVKQGAKSLVGALAVEPRGATWAATPDFQVFDHQDGQGTRQTRTQAKVNNDAFRSFSVVLTKGQTQYYKDGSPVEHMNGEGAGIPEDPQEASGMALNYGIEPMWFRFGILPQSAFGHAGVANSYGGFDNASEAYSNGLAVPFVGGPHGDPVTPVLQAKAGQPARIHITNPHGTTRGSTFALHGHVWQRDPYVCVNANGTLKVKDGLTGRCATTEVGSTAIGDNPIGFAQGGQESWNAPSHFEIVLPKAGGAFNVQGDYLFRDSASFGNASGVWGILRVGAQ